MVSFPATFVHMFAVSLPCINESLTGIAGISSSNCSWVFFIVAGDCKSEVLSDCKYQYMPPAMQAIKMIARITPWETLFFFSSEISCVSVVSSIFCSFSKSEVTGVITVFSDGVASSDAIVSKDVFFFTSFTSSQYGCIGDSHNFFLRFVCYLVSFYCFC